jgi:hypothetical protein
MIGKAPKPRPFIFSSPNQLDDDETIENLINNPAYNRSPKVMRGIAEKAMARRKEIEEEIESTINTLQDYE